MWNPFSAPFPGMTTTVSLFALSITATVCFFTIFKLPHPTSSCSRVYITAERGGNSETCTVQRESRDIPYSGRLDLLLPAPSSYSANYISRESQDLLRPPRSPRFTCSPPHPPHSIYTRVPHCLRSDTHHSSGKFPPAHTPHPNEINPTLLPAFCSPSNTHGGSRYDRNVKIGKKVRSFSESHLLSLYTYKTRPFHH